MRESQFLSGADAPGIPDVESASGASTPAEGASE